MVNLNKDYIFFFFIIFIYFYVYFILLYNSVLVLPYIDVNPDWTEEDRFEKYQSPAEKTLVICYGG